MICEWELHISYGLKPYKLKAELEYQSSQIMRIRVHGIKRSLLLENNYPFISNSKGKRAIKWKIREGEMDEANKNSSRLLMNIMEQLEFFLKQDFPATLL